MSLRNRPLAGTPASSRSKWSNADRRQNLLAPTARGAVLEELVENCRVGGLPSTLDGTRSLRTNVTFPDHFSARAAEYAAHRPRYPLALVDFLAGVVSHPGLVWDAGCGSGQLSVTLAERFERVIGTDASEKQIGMATRHTRVEYHTAPAESSGLPDGVADLVVAAQAAHWFDLPAYYQEVRRVGRPDSIIALITYGGMVIAGEVDRCIARFYSEVLAPYWPPERRLVEERYRSLPFPFAEIRGPALEIEVRWSLPEVLSYIRTWSATQALENAQGRARLEVFARDLRGRWGSAATVRSVCWPLYLRVGRIGHREAASPAGHAGGKSGT